jgi:hypothetical protein
MVLAEFPMAMATVMPNSSMQSWAQQSVNQLERAPTMAKAHQLGRARVKQMDQLVLEHQLVQALDPPREARLLLHRPVIALFGYLRTEL